MSNTLSDRTNKSIADIANKIMQEQPTKVRDFADTKPIESDMVQRVMNLNVPNHFVKEDAEQVDELSREFLSKKYLPAAASAHLTAKVFDGDDKKAAKRAAGWSRASAKLYPNEYKDSPKKAKVPATNEEVEQIDEVKAVVKAHGDKPATHAVYMTQHPTAAAGWRGPSRTLEVHVHAKDDEHAKKLATAATKNHGTGGWETPFVPSNPLWQPVKALKEDPEQLDETDYTHRVWFKPKDGKGSHFGVPAHSDDYSRAHKELHNYVGKKLATQYEPYKVEPYKTNEDVEHIEEARFGKAIDPSKLSAAARARLEARAKKAGKETPKAEPAPTSAAVGKRAGRAAPKAKESPMAALAQSFGAKKKAAPKAEPKDETPAQKVRRQNIERQKEYYAKGGSRSAMNVGSGGRTSITGHNTSTAGGAVNAVKSQGRIKTGGLHSIAVDEELKGNQTALDVAKPYGKLTAQDFKALRAKHKKGN
jgi:hypothetical protein